MSRIEYGDVVRYLNGESTPEEKRHMESWLKEDPNNQLSFEQIREIWRIAGESADVPPDHSFVRDDWVRLQEAMSASRPARTVERHRSTDRPARIHAHSRRRADRRLISVMATVFVLAVAAWLATLELRRGTAGTASVDFHEVATQAGQTARFVLDDGTTVRLNVASKIRYPGRLAGDVRAVTLEGEAFFDVAEDAGRPFVVHTQDAVVRVLGTAFNVRAYEEDGTVDVVVSEGRVSVQANGSGGEVVLAAREMGRLSGGRLQHFAGDVDVERHLAWMEGRLVFDGTPLREVAVELGRWYTLEVDGPGPDIAGWRLTASFRDESIDEMLEVIAATLDLRFERVRQRVTFYR